jgi:hypothetical protein
VSKESAKLDALVAHATSRREFLAKSAAVAASTLLSSCGGAGNPGPSTPTPTQTPPPAALSLVSMSPTSPTALTPITIQLAGFDSSQPFSIAFADPSGNPIPQNPIRSDSSGTIVIAAPIHIDGSTGATSSFSTTLTITQGGKAVSTPIVISDILPLSNYGIPLGMVSRAFYIHQAITLGQSINAQQAISMLPKASPANPVLIKNLTAQLLNVIYARNDLDRIVSDPSTSISIGTAQDGTSVAFNATSIEIMDRVIFQYLLAYTSNGTAIPALVHDSARPHGRRLKIAKQIAALTPSQAGSIIQAITALSGAASFKTTQQTLADPSSSTFDGVLSCASTALGLVTIGASVVALGAATVAGAPVIAAAAGAVATYSTIAGLVVGALSVGNDMYNVATNTYGWVTNQSGSSAADVGKAASALVSDVTISFLNAEGLGGLNAPAAVGPIASSVFKSIFADATSAEVELAAAGMLYSVQNLLIQSDLTSDSKAASNSIESVGPSNFGQVDGTASISNSEGPILSGLTGVGAGNNGSLPDALTSIGAPDGTYDLVLPIGSASLSYPSVNVVAFDPVDLYDPTINTLTVLDSVVVDLSTVSPTQPVAGPDLIGVCNDTDAGDPDGDDPDCD